MEQSTADRQWMEIAIEIARQGEGFVEPNPMVGCVLVREGHEIARGFHRAFGDKHAEIDALESCRQDPVGSTAYVSLEPCCHHGKTPPCANALVRAGIARVVVADPDPFPKVAGGGIEVLRRAGITVDVGILQKETRSLNAPWLKRVESGRPWVIAKWAMTLDGKIATRTGDSKWISSAESRELVHAIRGRVDGVVVGSQTALADDPLLTARPAGPRLATRIVVDSGLGTPLNSQLVRTAAEVPVLFAVGVKADPGKVVEFQRAGCQILTLDADNHSGRLEQLLDELGRREMTNILVEGGGGLLGSLLDLEQIDEVHVFINSRLVGGEDAAIPVRGNGVATINDAFRLASTHQRILGDDLYISGRVDRR